MYSLVTCILSLPCTNKSFKGIFINPIFIFFWTSFISTTNLLVNKYFTKSLKSIELSIEGSYFTSIIMSSFESFNKVELILIFSFFNINGLLKW